MISYSGTCLSDCDNTTLILVGTNANPSTPTVRVATPGATILKSTPGAIQQTIGGKQIITVHKASTGGSSSTGQPQIVTLVKTNQGMQVATVSYLAPLAVVWHHWSTTVVLVGQ